MLHIRFHIQDKLVTWSISNIYVFWTFYLLTFLIILLVQKLKSSKSTKKLPSVRGGDDRDLDFTFINSCIESDSAVHRIKSKRIFDAVQKILNNNNNIIVIDRVVFLLAILQATVLGPMIQIGGVQFYIENVSKFLQVLGSSIVFASSVYYIPQWLFVAVSGKVSFITTIFAIYFSFAIRNINLRCYDFLEQLPATTAANHERLYYIDEPKRGDKVLLVKNEESQQVYLKKSELSDCTITPVEPKLEFADSSGEELISNEVTFEETCTNIKSKYIPLKERTRTLSDLKNGDSRDQLEKTYEALPPGKDKQQLAERLKN